MARKGSKPKPKVLKKVNYQTQVENQTQRGKVMDEMLKALPAGMRLSKSGNKYWETRVNRSDMIQRKPRAPKKEAEKFVPLYLIAENKKPTKKSPTKKPAKKAKPKTAKKSTKSSKKWHFPW